MAFSEVGLNSFAVLKQFGGDFAGIIINFVVCVSVKTKYVARG